MNRETKTRTGWILAALALVAAHAGATTYYVALGGSDSNNGEYAADQGAPNGPFLTISHGADQLGPGDTLMIRGGTYSGTSATASPASGTAADPITICNYPNEQPVQDCEGLRQAFSSWGEGHFILDGLKWIRGEYYRSAAYLLGNHDMLLRNMTICSSISAGENQHTCSVKIEGASDITLYNCRLFHFYNAGHTQNASCFVNYTSTRITIQNCDLSDTPVGIYDKDGNQNTVILRNLIHDTEGEAMRIADEGPTADTEIHENIILGNNWIGIRIGLQDDTPKVWNNTIYHRRMSIVQGWEPSLQIWNNLSWLEQGDNYDLKTWSEISPAYCDYNSYYRDTGGINTPVAIRMDGYGGSYGFWNLASWQAWGGYGGGAAIGYDTHSFEVDPLLVAPGTDFHLQAGSPLRNAGVDGPNGTVDRDIGAYPFGDTTVVGLIPAGTPTVAVTDPTSSGSYVTSSSQITIGGTASDDGTVTSVTWENSRGGSGTAVGTTSWSVANISLAMGANVITVTAHDDGGQTGADVITVTYAPAVPDTTPPYVAQASPAADATDVALGANIVFHILDAGDGVDQATVIVRVEGAQITPVITGTSADLTVTYDPPADFSALQVVDVEVEADDLASPANHLSTSWSFTCIDPVAPDTAPPYVEQQSPLPAATGVPLNAVVRFHVRDAASGVDRTSIVLRVEGAIVAPTISGPSNDLTVVYDPPADFAALQEVDVELDADDLASTPNSVHVSWSFTCSDTVILPPPPPTGLSVATVTTDSLTVTFTASSGTDVVGYYLRYRNGTGGYVRVDVGNATTYVLSGLAPDTLYHLCVAAYDTADQESDPTPEIDATTLAPDDPPPDDPGDEDALDAFRVAPNIVTVAASPSVTIEGPPLLAGHSVSIFSVAGEDVGDILLEDEGDRAAAELGTDLEMEPGVYILTTGSGTARFQARLVVTP